MEGFILYFRTDYRSRKSVTKIHYHKTENEAIEQAERFFMPYDCSYWEGGFKKARQNLIESLKADQVFVVKNCSCKTDMRVTIRIVPCSYGGFANFELEQEDPI